MPYCILTRENSMDDEIIELRNRGYTVNEIAAWCDCSYEYVVSVLS